MISNWIEEQRELNKVNIVSSFVSSFIDEYHTLPDAETIQETFYQLDIDLSLIEKQINYHKEHTKWDIS